MSDVRIWGVPPRTERRIAGIIRAQYLDGARTIAVRYTPWVMPSYSDVPVPVPVPIAVHVKEIHFAVRHYRQPGFTMIGPQSAEDHRLLWEYEDMLIKEEFDRGEKIEKETIQRCPQCGCTIPK